MTYVPPVIPPSGKVPNVSTGMVADLNTAYNSMRTMSAALVDHDARLDEAIILRGAGIDPTGATDSTTALQAIIDANPGRILDLPVGVYKISNLTLNNAQHLRGAGWSSNGGAPEVYGHANWAVASTFAGTVLRSTATTGNALTVVPVTAREGSLSDFILIGPGSGTSVGILIGEPYHTAVHPVWRNIKVCNFSTGVLMCYVNEGSFYDLAIRGCDTPLNLYEQTNQNAFYGLDIQRNNGPVLIHVTSRVNAFYSPIGQSNLGTAFEVNGLKNVFVNPYFEHNGGYAIDVVDATGTMIIAPHFANAGMDACRIQAAASCTSITGFVTWAGVAITNAGSDTYLQGSFTGVLTDTGTRTTIIDSTAVWKSYTPVLTGTGWAIGNGTILGYWIRVGRTIHMKVRIVWGSTSTFGASVAPTITLPPSSACSFGEASVLGLRSGVGFYKMVGRLGGSSLVVSALGTSGLLGSVTATVPASWASTDVWEVSSTYES